MTAKWPDRAKTHFKLLAEKLPFVQVGHEPGHVVSVNKPATIAS
jgi:hypothetical protein